MNRWSHDERGRQLHVCTPRLLSMSERCCHTRNDWWCRIASENPWQRDTSLPGLVTNLKHKASRSTCWLAPLIQYPICAAECEIELFIYLSCQNPTAHNRLVSNHVRIPGNSHRHIFRLGIILVRKSPFLSVPATRLFPITPFRACTRTPRYASSPWAIPEVQDLTPDTVRRRKNFYQVSTCNLNGWNLGRGQPDKVREDAPDDG